MNQQVSRKIGIDLNVSGGTNFMIRSLIGIFIAWIIGMILLSNVDPIVLKKAVLDGEKIIAEAETFNFTTLWSWLLLFYAVFSWRFWSPVKENENAAIILLGKPVANIGSGPPYAPLFVSRVRTITSAILQREFPAEPENIYRGDQKTPIPLDSKLKPPIRVPFSTLISEDQAKEYFKDDLIVKSLDGKDIKFITKVSEDLLALRVTAEPSITVRLLIEDPSLFFRNIGGDLETVFKQIEDEIVSVVQNYYSRMSVAQALINLKWMSIILFKAIERRIRARGKNGEILSWGIDLQSVQVKLIHLDHGINAAISEAAQAERNKVRTITDSKAEKAKRVYEGVGAARAAKALEQATLEGRAQGLAKFAKLVGVEGREALSSEVARVIGESGNTIVIGVDGIKEIAGAATAFAKKKGSEQPSQPQQ